MNYLTLSDVEVEEYQASVYPESRFSVKDLSGYGRGGNKMADEIARIAIRLVRSGQASDIDDAVRMAMESYCSSKPVLSGLGDDQSVLDGVVADAQATQATHKRLIDNLATWPDQPVDAATRSVFSDELSRLEQDFTNRNLQAVGVQFPYQLDRTNPAHAILLAVRDDIKNTVALIDSGQMQAAVAKEVRAVQAPVATALLEKASQMYEGTAKAVTGLVKTVQKVAEDVGEAPKEVAKALPYIAAAVVVVGLIYFSSKGGDRHAA